VTAAQSTGIEVEMRHSPLAWLLYFTRPTVEIDGHPNRTRWGRQFFPAAPGQHTVTVYFGYLGRKETGKNSIAVDVPEGQVRRVEFKMPSWMLAKGKMRQL
jgi:hypothetical protein